MDAKTIKQQIISGALSEDELSAILNKGNSLSKRGGFLKTILKGFIEGYTAPNMWRMTLETFLLFSVITGIIILSYAGHLDMMITSVLLAFVLGFIFGKIK
ncbi:MAG: hypothetical protein K0Q95_3379 [Bacteroidota bacterium]|jgi:hypothetical protein|nr:hypothetical protein [Bacteroidota bacterium]